MRKETNMTPIPEKTKEKVIKVGSLSVPISLEHISEDECEFIRLELNHMFLVFWAVRGDDRSRESFNKTLLGALNLDKKR